MEKIQVSQTLPGAQLAFVSDHFLTSESSWSVSPYCVLRGNPEPESSKKKGKQGKAAGVGALLAPHSCRVLPGWPGCGS